MAHYRKELTLAALRSRTMLLTIVLGAALAVGPLFGQSPGTAHPDLNDHGIFQILAGGKNIGTEKFDIVASADKVEAKGEIRLRLPQAGKTVEVRSLPALVLDSQLQAQSYTWSQKGAQSSQLSIDFLPALARARYKTVKGEEDQRDFKLEKDIVVLDDNVLHHYQLVVARYNLAAAGKQDFHAFIPQEALPGTISVELVGAEPVTVEGTTVNLRHLVLSTELTRVDLYVDDQSRLQVVNVPAADFQAYRKK